MACRVHGVGWVILVRLVPVQALRHPVGGQQISAGQSRHLWHLGLHASVKVLEKHVIMRLKKGQWSDLDYNFRVQILHEMSAFVQNRGFSCFFACARHLLLSCLLLF